MTKDEFMKINELERHDILFMMATDDVDVALDRWNMLCTTDEDGDDCLEFDIEAVIDQLGEDIAKEMDEHIRAYFAKRELEEQMNKDLAEGKIIVDENGNMFVNEEAESAANEEL